MTARKTRWIILVTTALIALVAAFSYVSLNGIWPPDVFFPKPTLLGVAESSSGEQFKVIQFWKGYDLSYTTQLEHLSVDGTLRISVIDGDDLKQWPCSLQIIEPAKELIITLSDRSAPIEYRWDKKQFILSAGRERVRD